MSLQDWLANGWLVEHTTDSDEIGNLLSIAERDLKDSRVSAVSSDWRLNIAYNSALESAAAALAASGYRASRDFHHHRIIQSLKYTLSLSDDVVSRLDAFRKKRNIGSYESAGAVSEAEVRDMLTLAEKLRSDVNAWLEARHPELLGK